MNSEQKAQHLLKTGSINNFGHFDRRTSKADMLRAINALQIQNQVQVGVVQRQATTQTVLLASLWTYDKDNLLFRKEAGLVNEAIMKGVVSFVQTGKLETILNQAQKVIKEEKEAKLGKTAN